MTEDAWFVLELRVPDSAAEIVAALLWDHAITGIEENPEKPGHLTAFSREPWDEIGVRHKVLDAVQNVEAVSSEDTVWLRTRTIADQDWMERWKQSWTPTPMGERLLIVPDWWSKEIRQEGRAVLRLDPGFAFGTGTHETTQLAWELLESLLNTAAPLRLLDVGTGSGILARGARLLYSEVTAVGTEADAQAMLTLKAGVSSQPAVSPGFSVVHARSLPFRNGCFDVAVANLTWAEHRHVEFDLARVMARPGALVLSGLLSGQADAAERAWNARGAHLRARVSRGEWTALHMRLETG